MQPLNPGCRGGGQLALRPGQAGIAVVEDVLVGQRAGPQGVGIARQQPEIRRFHPRGIDQGGDVAFAQGLDGQRFEPGQPIEQRPSEDDRNRVGRRLDDRIGHG